MTEQTALAIPQELNLSETMQLGEVLAKSGFFSDTKQAAQAVVKVLCGREIGFGPIASMTGVHIVQGKPTIGANLLGASIKRDPRYDYRVIELTDTEAEIAFFQNGQELGRSRFTMDDAKAANLTNKSVWKQFPRNMLFARALSNGARWYTPDVFGGVTPYTPEELGAEVDQEGDVIDVTPTSKPAPEVKFKTRKEPATPKAEPAGNGDTDGINSPKALLAAVNDATTGYYNAIPHMLHAIQKMTGDEKWSWPLPSDVAAYKATYDMLIDYAKKEKAA